MRKKALSHIIHIIVKIPNLMNTLALKKIVNISKIENIHNFSKIRTPPVYNFGQSLINSFLPFQKQVVYIFKSSSNRLVAFQEGRN